MNLIQIFNQALDIKILYSHLIGNTITDYSKKAFWYKELLLRVFHSIGKKVIYILLGL